MSLALGIDTGGTYTDAVLIDQQKNLVLASAKALTTYRDLSIGISQAISSVLGETSGKVSPDDIDMVSLSTTLATNAIVQGHGSPVGLILIGYDPKLIQQYGFGEALATEHVAYVAGGHDGLGEQTKPLDETGLLAAVDALQNQVEALAISSYFSVRNPEHEVRARQLVEEHTRRSSGKPMPVTCGHELSSRLNSIRRATTCTLNARLIPLLQDLISTIRLSLDRHGVQAPLMVVKGDGSLVRAEWAMARPIETILSGPAASAVGAWHLAGQKDVWVVDVGGTTTDIANLCEGLPQIHPEGAQVGRWRTMVEAVDVSTLGLGGDSEVDLDRRVATANALRIGPRRVVPLSILADHEPEILTVLQDQVANPQHYRQPGRFALIRREEVPGLNADEKKLVDSLMSGPRSLHELIFEHGFEAMVLARIERLTAHRVLSQAAFTPTDALHVLGRLGLGNHEAARLGAELLAAQMGMAVHAFCRQVVERVSQKIATALVGKVLSDEGTIPNWEGEPTAQALLSRALDGTHPSALSSTLSLDRLIVAIGAPVEAYLPRTSDMLHTKLYIPTYAYVANAIGAVVGSVVQKRNIIIRPIGGDEDYYRTHLPNGVWDFPTLEETAAFAEQVMADYVQDLARQAGAEQIELRVDRRDRYAPIQETWGDELYLETKIEFTAIGRPSVARE